MHPFLTNILIFIMSYHKNHKNQNICLKVHFVGLYCEPFKDVKDRKGI